MLLENTFTVGVGIDQAWAVFTDPRQVVPCFPGAALENYEDDSFTGTVKVKLGPMSLTYRGEGTFVARDEAAHQIVISASCRDMKGNGTANATVTGTLSAEDDTRTNVKVVTTMTVTGRPAQFGRGVIAEASDKIVDQFSACLADKLGSPSEPPPSVPATPAPDPTAAAKPATTPATEPTAAQPAAAEHAVAPALAVAPSAAVPSGGAATNGSGPGLDVGSPTLGAIDLLDPAGASVVQRLAPALAGLLLLLIILQIVRSRKSR